MYIYIYIYICIYIYIYIYIYINTNSTIKFFSRCFINKKAMEPAITTYTLQAITILVTITIVFAYLKNISQNYLSKHSRINKETTEKISLSCLTKF